jgi:hypothetical protein
MDDSELHCTSSSLEAAIDSMKKFAEHLEARFKQEPPMKSRQKTSKSSAGRYGAGEGERGRV